MNNTVEIMNEIGEKGKYKAKSSFTTCAVMHIVIAIA